MSHLEGGTGQREAGRDVDPCESRESQDEDSGDLAPHTLPLTHHVL